MASQAARMELLGAQVIRRADGSEQPLGSVDEADLEPGDRLILKTPGGGGWGRVSSRRESEPR